MATLFTIILLVLIILLPILLVKPSITERLFKRVLNRKQILSVLGSGIVLSFVLVGISSPKVEKSEVNSKEKAVATPAITTSPDLSTKPEEAKLYEKLGYEELKTIENFYYLYSGSDKSKENLETVAKEIKVEECKKPCNISLYDNRQAALTDLDYKKLTTIADQNSWKEKNYIFVADHLLGYTEFSTDYFSYYPYKDSYYEELKSK